MIDQSLEEVFKDSMKRILTTTASPTDLALVLIMAELIDEVGGSKKMGEKIESLEAKWQQGLSEYTQGKV